MKINTSTDYAIRILIYLSEKKKTVSSSELSKHIFVSKRYLMQVAAKLRDGNMINANMGSEGGYKLTRDPGNITLYDIIALMEGTTRLIPSSAEAEESIMSHNTLHAVYQMLQRYWDAFLCEVSIEMMLHKSSADIQTTMLELLQARLDRAAVEVAREMTPEIMIDDLILERAENA